MHSGRFSGSRPFPCPLYPVSAPVPGYSAPAPIFRNKKQKQKWLRGFPARSRPFSSLIKNVILLWAINTYLSLLEKKGCAGALFASWNVFLFFFSFLQTKSYHSSTIGAFDAGIRLVFLVILASLALIGMWFDP